ncbi:group 1 truncated hemoglobin [Pseudoalteromonas fenneropenaei]|uniref:Group 1 truncated hemoglobin n=1 Tax=Pseudoalteromonas fenneropenaei TaxID=1737459 RepID=A0ABV7CPJ1_9GAMM
MKAVLFATLLLVSGCQTASPSLYQQIGAEAGAERLVDAFINQIGNDAQILPFFANASVAHFRAGFLTHMCDVLDGPCEYRGDSMVQIHTGMAIKEADFNRVVELLIAAMDEVGISVPVQNQILARLAPLRGEIIKI